MNFYSKFSRVDKTIQQKYEETLKDLLLRLKALNLQEIGISEYNQAYLSKHIKEFQKTSWFLSHIFMLIAEKNIPFSQITLIDYGGGAGILSYFAKMLGVGTLIYNDIYDVSCKDVKKISEKINIHIDYIMQGDIHEVVEQVKEEKLKIDFLLSFDVIEHIYNVEDWFNEVKKIQTEKLTVIQTSHANKYNLLINTKLTKLQKRAEYQEQKKEWGHKERDTLQSFFYVRKNIIKNQLPDLEESKLNYLSRQTRGLIEKDIVREVKKYAQNGKINYKPKHKNNTCDPLTGNWTEQFIDLKDLQKTIEKMGYECIITPGFYINTKGSNIVKVVKKIVNHIIYYLKFKGLLLSPYYVVNCEYSKIKNTD